MCMIKFVNDDKSLFMKISIPTELSKSNSYSQKLYIMQRSMFSSETQFLGCNLGIPPRLDVVVPSTFSMNRNYDQ